jgi:hypothetical protein
MTTKPVFDDVPEWPEAKPAAAHRGHNRPPLEELIPEEFRAELLRERPDFLTRYEQAVDAAERVVVDDEESLGRAGDLINIYRKLLKHIDATHKAVKQPYLDGGRLVDAEKNGLIGKVEDAKRSVEGIGNAFVAERDARLRAERAAREAEEREAAARAAAAERERERAEREAEQAVLNAANDVERRAAAERAEQAAREAEEAMAAASLAAASVIKPEPVRSDAGAAVSGKQEWQCAIEDVSKAFRHVKGDPKVHEAIEAAIKRLVRAGKREMTGVRIWPVVKGNYR